MEATLYVNKSESRCGACGKNADPYEETHISGQWYKDKRLAGCGAKFTSIASDYTHIGPEDIADMRPDLPWVGQQYKWEEIESENMKI